VGGAEWRVNAAASLFDAQHGERGGVPSSLSPRHPAGVSRSPRACVPILSRRLPAVALRHLKSAVKKILRGFRREETTRFIAFRSHRRFESDFCTPAEPHEKGGIEGEARYFRRNHWVPIPKARDLAELDAQLLAACPEDERRLIARHDRRVGALMLMIEERAHLLPLAEQGFELADILFPRVDGLGCMRVRTNLYSVPAPPDKTVEVRLYPSHVEVRDEGRCLALHERCYERHQQVLDLEHYLDVLEHKPGALIGSKPLALWRERGLWPQS
jgi:hypothetical protein